MATKTEWRPVIEDAWHDGLVVLDIRDNRFYAIIDNEEAFAYYFAANQRLCQAVTVEVPDVVAMPTLALEKMIQWYEQGANNVEQAEVDAVRAWLARLSAQERGGGDGAS